MITVQNKIIVVTGAAGGIGQALCRVFGTAANRIIALDRDAAALMTLQGVLQREGIFVTTVVADITHAADVQQALQAILENVGGVDVLINNAGGLTSLADGASMNLGRMTPAVWARDIELNLNGAYHCVEAVLPALKARGGGVILNIASVNALMTYGCPAYSAAKAGLISYTRSLATEFGRFNIRANAILPGTVRTDAWSTMERNNPKVFEDLLKWYPLGRIATADDIAQTAYFLASDAAQIITGAVLTLDAGLTAGNPVMAAEITCAVY